MGAAFAHQGLGLDPARARNLLAHDYLKPKLLPPKSSASSRAMSVKSLRKSRRMNDACSRSNGVRH
jgi:hypothetical protein